MNNILKSSSKFEKSYSLLEAALRAAILENKFSDGVAIPPETELAKQHGISRTTARKALDTLVKEGLLRKIQGKGTFVIPENERLNNSASTKTRQIVLLSFETFLSKETFYEENTYLPIITGINKVLQEKTTTFS